MAVKRLCKEETETEGERMVDRLSCMPESMQLRILSFLDVKDAIGTSVLTKSWVSSWTSIPILNFSSFAFKQLDVFDNFVANALSRRQPVKLDKLTFKRDGECCSKTLEKVFNYAFSHGVEELEANVVPTRGDHVSWNWPIWSSDSLTSLKLESKYFVSCPFLESRSVGTFKNLTNLNLNRAIIEDLDPFSGFLVLEKLTLVCCYIKSDGNVLNVRAPQLREFTFVYHGEDVDRCEFTTPKLRYFEWGQNGFPELKAHFPVLDTVVINYNGRCLNYYGHFLKKQEKIKFDNLLTWFNTLSAAKLLTVSAPIVRLLTLFPVNGCSPFQALKCLKLDFGSRHLSTYSNVSLSKTLKLVPRVKAYLLSMSRDAKCTLIKDQETPCSSSQKSTCSTTRRQAPLQALRRPKCMVKKPTRNLD